MPFARIWRCVKQNFAGSAASSAFPPRVLQEGVAPAKPPPLSPENQLKSHKSPQVPQGNNNNNDDDGIVCCHFEAKGCDAKEIAGGGPSK